MATVRTQYRSDAGIQPAPIPVPLFNLDVPKESATGLFTSSLDGAHAASESSNERPAPSLFRQILFPGDGIPSEPGPPPDGGLTAWTQVAMGHLVIVVTWGWIVSYGVFQTYYVKTLNHPPADISWVGSIQIFLLFGIGTFAGRATDAGYFRPIFVSGIVVQLLGVFGSSFATTYWQLFLSQGVATGLGNGLMFCPTFAVIPPYFDKKRALALACVSSGTSTGGLLFPGIIETLLPRIGFGWTVRVIGFIMTACLVAAALLLQPRLPPCQKGPLIDKTAFREPAYVLYSVGVFAMFLGIYPAFYYVGEFAASVLQVDQESSIHLLLIMNGIGLPTRVLAGFVADRWTGSLNTLIALTAAAGIIVYGWIAVRDYRGLLTFAIIYGMVAAAVQGLAIPALTVLTPDLKKIGTRLGMVFTFVSFATVSGSPIAGALIQNNNGSYTLAQVFSATTLITGSLVLVLARLASSARMVRVRVDASRGNP